MTINRTYDTVTFWDVKDHRHYTLRGRIAKGQEKYLQGYLSPNITPEKKAKIDKLREHNKSLYESQFSMESRPADDSEEGRR